MPLVATKLYVVSANSDHGWMAVHRADCAETRKLAERGAGGYIIEAETLTGAAVVLASDFIAEGSMTIEQALGYITFMPCVKLPQ
jgi:hypothetical protein